MTTVNGYKFDDTKGHKTSTSVWWRAEKNGQSWFLKCFDSPIAPSSRASEKVKKIQKEKFDKFIGERRRILSALRSMVGSNIVAPVEIFEHDGRIYQVTAWQPPVSDSLAEISRYKESDKERLFKIAANNLSVIHKKGFVHLDIKPENLPVSVSNVSKQLALTLIDFDSSYFVNCLPEPEIAPCTPPYVSPEYAAYMQQNSKYGGMAAVTGKNDVFALAIVFHEYWTGRKFIYNGSDDEKNGRYLYMAVDAGEEIKVAPGVPDWLEALLMWMIEKNPEDRASAEQVLEGLKDHSKIKGFGGGKTDTGALKIAITSSDGRVDGFTFRVTGTNGYSKTFKSDRSGIIAIEGLDVGEYNVSEVVDSTSSAYSHPSDKKVNVAADSTTTVEMHNNKGFGDPVGALKIAITSSDGRVDGFTFRVTGAKGYSKTFKSDKSGIIVVEGLDVGEYNVSELVDSMSSAYSCPSDKKVNVAADSTTTVEMYNNKKSSGGGGKYVKGDNFPSNAVSFEIAPNGRLFVLKYADNSTASYQIAFGLRKGYIKREGE